MPGDLLSYLDRLADEYGVPRSQARAIYQLESASGRNVRPSSAGAQGHMQLMPGTAREMGVTNINDPYQNLRGGVKYYSQQLRRFGDPALAAAAYNAGPGRVARAGGVPNIDETRRYVANFRNMLGQAPAATPTGGTVEDDTETETPAGGLASAAGAPDPATAYKSLQALETEAMQRQKQAAAVRRQQFEAAQAAINARRYGGLDKSEQLFRIAQAFFTPPSAQNPGFGGVMQNLNSALSDITTARRNAEEQRADALLKLRQQYAAGELAGADKEFDSRLDVAKAVAGLAKRGPSQWSGATFVPGTGWVPRPDSGARPVAIGTKVVGGQNRTIYSDGSFTVTLSNGKTARYSAEGHLIDG